ncbi:MAG: hypothetical protein O3B09_03610 [Proteobacteria bacterium]|nr:hypothetical protein [Pseudomonadota bacterium]
MFKKSATYLLLILLTACSTKIANFESYQKSLIPKTSFMPTAEMVEGKPPKVVVFKLDEEENNEVAKQAGLGEAMMVDIENVLTQRRLAKLIDRKAAAKLEKEIALAELNKTGSYKGPQIADYAISGSISNAGFTKKYTASRISISLQGEITRKPAKFTYSSQVVGNVKIYELPSMAVAENFEFDGKKSRSESVLTDNNVSVLGLVEFGGQKVKGLDRDDSLVRKAGNEAIDSISYKIQNFFAKRGYILEKRVLGKKKPIFKINLGSSDGMKKGDKFEIVTKYENENPITGKSEIESRVLTSGKVSNIINPDSAWIIIDKKDAADLIRIGDIVQFKYKRGFFNKTMKMVEGFVSN